MSPRRRVTIGLDLDPGEALALAHALEDLVAEVWAVYRRDNPDDEDEPAPSGGAPGPT